MNHKSGTEWKQNDDGVWEATMPDGALAHVWQDGRWKFQVFLECGLDILDMCGYMRVDQAQTAATQACGIWGAGYAVWKSAEKKA